jgi:hypothetical protein
LRTAAFAIVILCVDVAAAQNYPNRVIKIIVPFDRRFAGCGCPRVRSIAATIGATVIDNRQAPTRRLEARLQPC